MGRGSKGSVSARRVTPRFVFHAYPEVIPGIRRCVLARFPYGLFHRVRAIRIEVLAVFHHRRNPNVWRQRAAVKRGVEADGGTDD